jgi:predicted nucleic acid-binding protein
MTNIAETSDANEFEPVTQDYYKDLIYSETVGLLAEKANIYFDKRLAQTIELSNFLSGRGTWVTDEDSMLRSVKYNDELFKAFVDTANVVIPSREAFDSAVQQ